MSGGSIRNRKGDAPGFRPQIGVGRMGRGGAPFGWGRGAKRGARGRVCWG